ncbi:MAG TPA: discoidin domain-containing protein [Candidatus Limnocylindrales bacterium]|nr:discoidin domain-containing protein [Candidatus Limnocylindrales bacterium]
MPGSGPSPAEPGAWPGLNLPAGLSSAVEAETAELVAAIGNPDTGAPSPAWQAFESALTGGDPATIRASAETVIGHLGAACDAVAAYFDDPSAEAWAADVRGLLDGLALAVLALRDAGVRHDDAALEAARGQMQVVLLDHFYQSFKMSDPAAWRVELPSSGWSATASHARWHTGEVGAAVDGQADTMWLAGDVPSPQWIEVDFGAELAVSGIRLLTCQETAGATDHRVTVRTGTGTETELVRFYGDTRDGQWLEFAAPSPVEQIRYVRVTTLASPSTIGWREVEVTLDAAAAPAPCPASTTVVTDIAKTAARPSDQASDQGLAVDGDEATGWDPGPVAGGAGVRGAIRVWYAAQVRISEIRVLLGPGSAAATYEVVLFPPGELGTGLGTLEPVPAGGGWVTIAGPNPCLPYESVYISVRSDEPAGIVQEIQVIGS